MAVTDLEPLPARQPWEEPPAAGWSSHLGGLGLEFLAVIAALAAAVGTWRAVTMALQPDAAPTPNINWGRVFLWCLAALLCAALVVIIWRRLGGLALVGAMLTDHGRVARFGGRPPIWLDDPPESGLRVIHLSDLHVTEGDRIRMVEHASPGGNVALRGLLRRPELGTADVVLFTGDITDRGTAGSWGELLKFIRETGVAERAVLVPGNHDLALVDPWAGFRDPGGRWRRNDRFGIVQLANLLKFGQAFAATGGGRRGLVLGKDGPVPFEMAWVEVERAVRPFIESLPTTPVPRLRLGRGFWRSRHDVRAYEAAIVRARKQLLGLFPVAVPYPQQDAVLFVLNSCTPTSRHPATNGLGWVGRAQSRRLSKLSRAFQQPLKLVALHHHVVRRAEEQGHDLVSRIMAKFAVLGDARRVVYFCRKHGVRAVFNGHRHLSYQLRLPRRTVLMAAPSSTLGDELAHDPRPQFERYHLAPFVEEPTVGIYREVFRTPLPAR
jgi:hypothetical protein